MRQLSPPLLAVLLIALFPRGAAGQDFPPPDQASKLHLGEEPPFVGPILGGGIAIGNVTSLGDGKNFDGASLFSSGKFFHGVAGIRFGGFGLAGIYHQGTPGVTAKGCPGGGCTAEAKQKGLLAMLCMGGGVPGPLITLGVGGWGDQVEIKNGGGLVQRLEGWSFVERMAVEFPVGPPTSRFRLGGFFILTITNYGKAVTPTSSTTIPSTADTPVWGEIGISASFF